MERSTSALNTLLVQAWSLQAASNIDHHDFHITLDVLRYRRHHVRDAILSSASLDLSLSSSSWNAFCRCLEFHCNVLDILLTQSSLRRPGGITFAKGYREADMVT